jgi:hypothetical protein
MSIYVGRPPVNAPYKVRRDPNQNGKKLVFEAMWKVEKAPPNTEVGLLAISKVTVEGTTAQIRIFQVLGERKIAVGEVLYAPYENGKVETVWRTMPVKGGDFEAGEYHFEVSVGSNYGETTKGLLLRDTTVRLNQSSFETAKPKPKVVF